MEPPSLAQEAAQILNKQQIQSKQDWIKIMKGLSSKKIISFSEQRLIPEDNLRFPITFQEAERILVQAKSNPDLIVLVFQIKGLAETLRQTNKTMEAWKEFGLTKEQTAQLEMMMKSFKQKISCLKNQLQQFLKQTSNIDESFLLNIQRLAQATEVLEEKSAEEYQQAYYLQIQEYFQKIKVRQVIEKPSNKPQTRVQDNKTFNTYVALSKSDYKPVQVIKISKGYNNYKKLEEILNTFDAQRQLSFSPYFQKYFGYANNLTEITHHHYFNQIIEGVSLEELLSSTQYHLQQQTPIYQYWCRELFFAFRDILCKTTYMPILPIPLSFIYISSSGIQLKLKGVRFNRFRRQNQNRGLLQAKLLRNYGLLCLQMLGLEEDEIEEVKKVNIKILLKGLLRSQFQQTKFDKGMSEKRLSFGLCKNFPILSDQFVVDANGQALIQNYREIFGK